MEESSGRNQYSIPGILHFIQHEWARFEMERSQWEVEKAELQARIAFLQVTTPSCSYFPLKEQ
jgi:striatin 1/3/4